jgi:Mg2+-importing ATPase
VNLFTDLPEMTIATDRVDADTVGRPQRWNLGFVRRFMLVFGPLSSLFDLCTFAALAWVLRASMPVFRTAWFVESVVSACLIVLVVRSRQPLRSSRPSRALLGTSFAVIALVVALPLTPLAPHLGFAVPPVSVILSVAAIVAAYFASALFVKRLFYARSGRAP